MKKFNFLLILNILLLVFLAVQRMMMVKIRKHQTFG